MLGLHISLYGAALLSGGGGRTADWVLTTGIWNDTEFWKDTGIWNDGPSGWVITTGIWNDSEFWQDTGIWRD